MFRTIPAQKGARTMATEIDLTVLAGRVGSSEKRIKRVVTRERKPNPFEPALQASWDEREEGATVGATKEIRGYTPEQTTAIVRALRRASDTLGIGVRIDAPEETYMAQVRQLDEDGEPIQATDEDGELLWEDEEDEDGNDIPTYVMVEKERKRYRQGTVLFEAVPRQKRTRKNGNASEDGQEAVSEDESEAVSEAV